MSPFLDRQLFLLFWVSILWGIDKVGANSGAISFTDLFIVTIGGVILGVILQFIFDKP